MEFCKAFNARTAQLEKGTPISRHYRLSGPLVHLRDAPAAGDLLPQEGGEPQARQEAGFRRQDAGPRLRRQGDKEQVREIAEKKIVDLNCETIEAAMKMIEGSARSMGLQVVG